MLKFVTISCVCIDQASNPFPAPTERKKVTLLDFFSPKKAGRRTVLLDRWIVRSVPLEFVEGNGHKKVPTRGKPGLERPERPRRERIEGSCGKHL
ncbi:hypothetical protein TNCV_3185781 [Trichonephila clavipes]|nr:hypothetical protein TNCV_3185781 [Trichonephila clavipes]